MARTFSDCNIRRKHDVECLNFRGNQTDGYYCVSVQLSNLNVWLFMYYFDDNLKEINVTKFKYDK